MQNWGLTSKTPPTHACIIPEAYSSSIHYKLKKVSMVTNPGRMIQIYTFFYIVSDNFDTFF